MQQWQAPADTLVASVEGPMAHRFRGPFGDAAVGGATPGIGFSGPGASWQRQWETMRDRATYAMAFSSAFATDALLDLSRTFLQAVHTGQAENQPAHSAEGTIRLDDVYHLHNLARGAHSAVAQSMGTLGPRRRWTLQHSLGGCAVLALSTLVLVHLAFVTPFTQLAAADALSRVVYAAGSWDDKADGTCLSSAVQAPTIVRLEVLNASWPQQWLRPHILRLQQASVEARARNELAELEQRTSGAGDDRNATIAQSLGYMFFPRFVDVVIWAYDVVFPTPRYEVVYGADSSSWLEVQSPNARAALGIKTVDLQLSARDSNFFGPQWARELLSLLHLYDLYVLHALPLHFVRMRGSSVDDFRLYATVVSGQPQGIDLAPVSKTVSMAGPGWSRLVWAARRLFSACVILPIALAGSFCLSAFLRRLAVLSVRMQVYSSYTVRQMRRYAFIAEPLRRINCYSSNELLELWTAWAACVGLAIWMLSEAFRSGGAWAGSLLCYALAEYWGIVHVRTLQSRWIFPRAVVLLHAGNIAYATWWPLCPGWLLFWSLASSQLWLMFYLLTTFDCFAILPDQPPHRLLFRSLFLPAVPLYRSAGETCAPCQQPEDSTAATAAAAAAAAVAAAASAGVSGAPCAEAHSRPMQPAAAPGSANAAPRAAAMSDGGAATINFVVSGSAAAVGAPTPLGRRPGRLRHGVDKATQTDDMDCCCDVLPHDLSGPGLPSTSRRMPL